MFQGAVSKDEGYEDLKSRSGSPCKPLIAASFRNVSHLFHKVYLRLDPGNSPRHRRETWLVFHGNAVPGIRYDSAGQQKRTSRSIIQLYGSPALTPNYGQLVFRR